MNELEKEVIETVLDFDDDNALELVKKMQSLGMSSLEILEICKNAMDKIGKMFKEKEIFLTELIMAGEFLNTVMTELKLTENNLKTNDNKNNIRILIGTVEGDVHNIGKNIMKSLLVSEGYNVLDVGVDVPTIKFVEEYKKHNPHVIAMSGLITIAYDSMKNVVQAFENEGIRKNVKIIVGGGAINEELAKFIGTDDFGDSAVDGIKKINNWFE